MNCSNCGSALPAKSNICTYCESLNDTDLRGITDRSVAGAVAPRVCPMCGVNMKHVEVPGYFIIERCDNCYGLFFDPSELEALTDTAVSHVYEVDLIRLKNIIEEEGVKSERDQSYVRCPVCREMMNRQQFGSRSGVVIDRCRLHGVWLDAGELGQVFKWIKAGGRIYDEKRQLDALKREQIAIKGKIAGAQASADDYDDNPSVRMLLDVISSFL